MRKIKVVLPGRVRVQQAREVHYSVLSVYLTVWVLHTVTKQEEHFSVLSVYLTVWLLHTVTKQEEHHSVLSVHFTV